MAQEQKQQAKPVIFVVFTFLITWCCIFLLEFLRGRQLWFWVLFLDFLKSAAPLIVALFLLGKQFRTKGLGAAFFLGEKQKPSAYILVVFIFILQFVCFFLFSAEKGNLAPSIFFSAFMGQFFFGGALEEGGWRGYLFPALSRKAPVLLASFITSMIWSVWHLPYFLIPSSFQYGSSFIAYSMVTVLTGFILSAIYMLTKSVLLCTLFHAFQNTLVLLLQPDMGNIFLMGFFFAIGIGGMILCHYAACKEKSAKAASIYCDIEMSDTP